MNVPDFTTIPFSDPAPSPVQSSRPATPTNEGIDAMKMNTYVHAETAGKVTAVHVKVGDPVEEGQPMVTIR